ncbi:MAG: class I SAM-dependent methyltransferase [Spirochaetota bacterium]
MSLYENLAPVYDELFPLNPATIDFLQGSTSGDGGRRKALDLGSATGDHALALAALGWELTAVEPSSLLAEASRKKASASGLPVTTILGDMRDLGNFVEPGSQDLVLCLGNTLPHLESMAEIEDLLGKARKALRQGGSLILQLINFSLTREGFVFPVIKKGSTEFARSYTEGSKGRIGFDTRLTIEGRGTWRDRTELFPIAPRALGAALAKSGFASTERYSNWERESFEEDSSRFLIIAAR